MGAGDEIHIRDSTEISGPIFEDDGSATTGDRMDVGDHMLLGSGAFMMNNPTPMFQQLENGEAFVKRLAKFVKKCVALEDDYQKSISKLVNQTRKEYEKQKDNRYLGIFHNFKDLFFNMMSTKVVSHQMFVQEVTDNVLAPLNQAHQELTDTRLKVQKEFENAQKEYTKLEEKVKSAQSEAQKLHAKLQKLHKEHEEDGPSSPKESFERNEKKICPKVRVGFERYEKLLKELNQSKMHNYYTLYPSYLDVLDQTEQKRAASLKDSFVRYCEASAAFANPLEPLAASVKSKAQEITPEKSFSMLIQSLVKSHKFPPPPLLSTHELTDLSDHITLTSYKKCLNSEGAFLKLPLIGRVVRQWTPQFQSDIKLSEGQLVRIMCQRVFKHRKHVPESEVWYGELLGECSVMGTFPSFCVEYIKPTKAQDITMDMIMHWPEGQQIFREFLAKEWSQENFEFWQEIRHFRTKYRSIDRFGSECLPLSETMDGLKKRARRLSIKYISESAVRQVNIKGQVRDDITYVLFEMGTCDHNVFLGAEIEITKLLRQDSFPRFRRTPEFEAFAKRLRSDMFVYQNAEFNELLIDTGGVFALGKPGPFEMECCAKNCTIKGPSTVCVNHSMFCKSIDCVRLAPLRGLCRACFNSSKEKENKLQILVPPLPNNERAAQRSTSTPIPPSARTSAIPTRALQPTRSPRSLSSPSPIKSSTLKSAPSPPLSPSQSQRKFIDSRNSRNSRNFELPRSSIDSNYSLSSDGTPDSRLSTMMLQSAISTPPPPPTPTSREFTLETFGEEDEDEAKRPAKPEKPTKSASKPAKAAKPAKRPSVTSPKLQDSRLSGEILLEALATAPPPPPKPARKSGP